MKKEKIVVYGLTTEGYFLASQMAMKGADVSIIDESSPSAVSLKAETAKTYPNLTAFQEDEPLLSVEPIDVAISNAKYLFFAPRIRKTGQDLRTELTSKYKDATKALKKGSSIIYCLPTGLGGNQENIALLTHVTGLDAGKTISYFYFPLNDLDETPEVIGSLDNQDDKILSSLLSTEKKKKYVSLTSAECIYGINIIQKFTNLSAILEICKFVKDTESTTFNNFKTIYLDDIIKGLYDLRLLGSSFEGANTLLYLTNASIKAIAGYIKRLIDTIRTTLKKNELKASRTKIVLSWTLDKNEMRGDKIEILNSITAKLRDYIGDVDTSEGLVNSFHSDKKLSLYPVL
uniref:Uncharacterized protein n=1 Tax=uncultured marine thaumarchaeote SAT1000_06_A02 TaxID=1456359 RepID=A0A075I4L3_9ARCH|nr:hypothetical protein [uncultured marine thaumarchaeote SAT1000_06_A02]